MTESIFIHCLKGCDSFNKVKYLTLCVTLNTLYCSNLNYVTTVYYHIQSTPWIDMVCTIHKAHVCPE